MLYLEQKEKEMHPLEFSRFIGIPLGLAQGIEGTVKIAINHLDGLAQTMQHNPSNANAPDLPQEMLKKIAEMTKMIGLEEMEANKPEPHCNCPHCQVARVIHKLPETILPKEPEEPIEDPIKEEDLHFENWMIHQLEEKLYTVTSKLDPNETYQVFLGSPVGCTCGKCGCEHILSVLKS
jgi:hypothetical protein